MIVLPALVAVVRVVWVVIGNKQLMSPYLLKIILSRSDVPLLMITREQLSKDSSTHFHMILASLFGTSRDIVNSAERKPKHGRERKLY